MYTRDAFRPADPARAFELIESIRLGTVVTKTAETAAALGGCSLQGGKGTIVGTMLAVVLLGVLANGLVILDVSSFWQDIAQGALLVAAVVIQQRRASGRGVGLPT